MPAEFDDSSISLALKKLAHKFPEVRDKILLEAAEKIGSAIEERTPRSERDIRHHAQDSLVISKVSNEGEVFGGYTKKSKVASRIHFVEYGTINIKPANFIGGTLEELEKEIMNFIAKELKKGFGLQ